jgi:hypothetical protein
MKRIAVIAVMLVTMLCGSGCALLPHPPAVLPGPGTVGEPFRCTSATGQPPIVHRDGTPCP